MILKEQKNTKSNNPDEGYLLIYQKLFDALEKEGLKKSLTQKDQILMSISMKLLVKYL